MYEEKKSTITFSWKGLTLESKLASFLLSQYRLKHTKKLCIKNVTGETISAKHTILSYSIDYFQPLCVKQGIKNKMPFPVTNIYPAEKMHSNGRILYDTFPV